jgi:hypothetical protein
MGASKAVATAVFGRVSQFLRWPILSPWHNKGHNGTVAPTEDGATGDPFAVFRIRSHQSLLTSHQSPLTSIHIWHFRRSQRSALSSVDPA